MKNLLLLLALFVLPLSAHANQCPALLDHEVRSLGKETSVNLCDEYLGKVILVVNTASRCAYTDQYETLEALYSKYRDDGLVVLGFPSNDFGNQEPGTEKEIKSFCRMTYGVQFPMFAKTTVLESNATPFYKGLAEAAGRYPRWNFHKYLIDRNGNLVDDFRSGRDPMKNPVLGAVRKELAKKADS